VAVDDVLEEFAETRVERIQVNSPVNDPHESVMLIDREVFH